LTSFLASKLRACTNTDSIVERFKAGKPLAYFVSV